MKKLLFVFSFLFAALAAKADHEYLTIRMRGTEIFVNYSNGKTEVTKLTKADFGEGQEADIPALKMMEKLSASGWELVDMELVENGVRYMYIMKRDKK